MWPLAYSRLEIVMSEFSERLDAIEARANAATAGPWMPLMSWELIVTDSQDGMLHVVRTVDEFDRQENAEFIAAARTDIPWLLAELRKAQQIRLALRQLVELKDGPRDEVYEQRKPLAWEVVRRLLKGEVSS